MMKMILNHFRTRLINSFWSTWDIEANILMCSFKSNEMEGKTPAEIYFLISIWEIAFYHVPMMGFYLL